MERRRFLQLLGLAPVAVSIKLPKGETEELVKDIKPENRGDANLDEIRYYEVKLTQGDKTVKRQFTTQKHLIMPIRKGEGFYKVQVRAVDDFGRSTNWSPSRNATFDGKNLKVEWEGV